MRVFHWKRHSNRLYNPRVGCKSPGIGDGNHKKACENAGSVTYSPYHIAHTCLSGWSTYKPLTDKQ